MPELCLPKIPFNIEEDHGLLPAPIGASIVAAHILKVEIPRCRPLVVGLSLSADLDGLLLRMVRVCKKCTIVIMGRFVTNTLKS